MTIRGNVEHRRLTHIDVAQSVFDRIPGRRHICRIDGPEGAHHFMIWFTRRLKNGLVRLYLERQD